jgi:hypothetical protein
MKKLLLLIILIITSLTAFPQINETNFYSMECYIAKMQNGIASFSVNRNDYNIYGLVRIDGTVLSQPIYASITFDGDYIFAQHGFLSPYGAFSSKTGKQVIPFKYRLIDYIPEASAFLLSINDPKDKEWKWGAADLQGKETIKPIYHKLTLVSKNVAVARMKDKIALLNASGLKITEFIYEDWHASKVDEKNYYKYLAVKKEGKWGIIDFTGKQIIPFKYDSVDVGIKGLHTVCLNGKWGFISNEDKHITELKYDEAWEMVEGMAKVKINGKYGFVNAKGELAVPAELTEAHSRFYKEGITWGIYKDSCVLINKAAKILLMDKFDKTKKENGYEVYYIRNGWSKANKNGYWTLIGSKGEVPYKYVFTYIGDPEEGGYIPATWEWNSTKNSSYFDTTGVLKDQYTFRQTNSFQNGYAIVRTKDFRDLIVDKAMNVVFPSPKNDWRYKNKDQVCRTAPGQKVCLTSVDDNFNPFTLIGQVEETTSNSLCRVKVMVTDVKTQTGKVVINGMEYQRNDTR